MLFAMELLWHDTGLLRQGLSKGFRRLWRSIAVSDFNFGDIVNIQHNIKVIFHVNIKSNINYNGFLYFINDD